jgi:hypothetical protein
MTTKMTTRTLEVPGAKLFYASPSNVGVLRWSWRVGYYSASAFAVGGSHPPAGRGSPWAAGNGHGYASVCGGWGASVG